MSASSSICITTSQGRPYADRAEMTRQCLRAARDVGIAFTALPVLYRFGGFGGAPATDGQRRFLNDADGFLEIVEHLQADTGKDPNCETGIAPHSLRAVTGELLRAVLDAVPDSSLAAVHVHIAEQVREVEDCLAWSGCRPVQWLFEHFEVDESWCLVHATHMNGNRNCPLSQIAVRWRAFVRPPRPIWAMDCSMR